MNKGTSNTFPVTVYSLKKSENQELLSSITHFNVPCIGDWTDLFVKLI